MSIFEEYGAFKLSRFCCPCVFVILFFVFFFILYIWNILDLITFFFFFFFISDKLYMHRTCSARMSHFKIMMIDGVCRSERTGNGYLCMCGKHLCNSAGKHKPCSSVYIAVLCLVLFLKQSTLSWIS